LQLTRDLRREGGSVLITAMLVMLIMLALGLALLALSDVQAQQSRLERTRDQSFNLAESVLTSEAYTLGRAWPITGVAAPSGTGSTGAAASCSSSAFGAVLGTTATAGTATARIQPNLSTSYTGDDYSGASWQVGVCDDTDLATVWSNTLFTGATSTSNYDYNANNRMWVRAQATVRGVARTVVGLVDIGSVAPLPTGFALINGSMGIEVSSTLGSSGSGLVGGLVSGLLGSNDPLIVGRIGIRCGVFDINLAQNCLGGNSLNPMSQGLLSGIVDGGLLGSSTSTNQFTQYPVDTAVSPDTIAQLRSQSIATGTYTPVAASTSHPTATNWPGTSTGTPPACTQPTGGLKAGKIWFIEQVGNGDDYCTISTTITPVPSMIVVGSGRLVISDNGNNPDPGRYLSTVIYALNLQRPSPESTTPAREIIRIDKGARIKGAVYTDGKNSRVGIYPTTSCNGLLNCLLGLLGLSAVLNLLVGQVGQQGPVIVYDQPTVAAIRVFTTSAIVPGTFHEL
jgi:Tfp pilus assembly protein PilX